MQTSQINARLCPLRLGACLKLVFCLSLLIFLLPAPQAKAWNGSQIKWLSYSTGLKKAQKTGKPILMVFSAPWCQKCKQYKKLFYSRQVVKLAKQMVMIRVNITANRKLQQQFAIDGSYIPRTLALSPDGYHYDDLGGSQPDAKYYLDIKNPSELVAVMQGAIAKSY